MGKYGKKQNTKCWLSKSEQMQKYLQWRICFFCFCLRNGKNSKTNQKMEKQAAEEVFLFSRFFADFDLRNTFFHKILKNENPVSSFLFKKRALNFYSGIGTAPKSNEKSFEF